MLKYCLLSFLLLTFLLSACNTAVTTEPTSTQLPTPTNSPTHTPMPPTTTSTPAPTSTPESIRVSAAAEGFSIAVPYFLRHQVNENIVLIGDDENILNISFTGDTYDGLPLADVIDSYLASLEKRGWQFTTGEQTEIQLDGVAGLTVDLIGTAGDISFEGQAVAVSPRPDFVVFGLGISKINDDKQAWNNKGKTIFQELTRSIEFADTSAVCPISSDKTYGFAETNPIKVGGDAFHGPSRERAYLDHLRGPNGEDISYEREGSLSSGDTILDAYRVTGPGIDVVLYLDEYNFSELQAPVGFTCNGAFPISSP